MKQNIENNFSTMQIWFRFKKIPKADKCMNLSRIYKLVT